VGGRTYSPKDGSYLFEWTGDGLAKDDTSGDNHSNLGSGIRGTANGELTADARDSFPHTLQTEMSILALFRERRVDTDTIVPNLHGKIVPIFQFNL
jgi:hypothetical protein